VAALLAAEARPGDATFDFSSPTLRVKLSLPRISSITKANLVKITAGSLQHARMVRTRFGEIPPLEHCRYVLDGTTLQTCLAEIGHCQWQPAACMEGTAWNMILQSRRER
jgi:hypothetical protein